VAGLSGRGFKPVVPVIQLPCPELIYFGKFRWEVTWEQLNTAGYRRFCRELFEPYADMVEELARGGDVIFEVVGVSKSPSCGCMTTTVGYCGGRVREVEHTHIAGRGVFIEEIERELEKRGIYVRFCDA
jgi:predicted secreted protein